MIYARDPETNQKIGAARGAEGVCPLCWQPLIPHCGEIIAPHWKHQAGEACDSFYETETWWHRFWKKQFPQTYVEVTIKRGGEIHIADVHLPNGLTIELQHSPISLDDIRERERFYGPSLTWVFDVREPYQNERLILYPPTMDKPRWTFRWKHPRKTIGMTERSCLLDLGYPQRDELEELPWQITPSAHRLFFLRKLYLKDGPPYGGWGEMTHRAALLLRLGATSPPP